jgi:flagellar export protein FliJ
MSLKRIVEYRRHVEDLARGELFNITQAFAAQQNAVSRLEKDLERVLEKIAASKRDTVLVDEALNLYRLAGGMSADLGTARRLAESLKVRKQSNQASLLSAARESRITEKLDAKRDREKSVAQDRKEQKSNDELSINRWQALAATGRQGNFLPESDAKSSGSEQRKRGSGDQKKSGGT